MFKICVDDDDFCVWGYNDIFKVVNRCISWKIVFEMYFIDSFGWNFIVDYRKYSKFESIYDNDLFMMRNDMIYVFRICCFNDFFNFIIYV